MPHSFPGSAVLRGFALVVAVLIGSVTAAPAAVISSSPTLPLLGIPFSSTVGVGCFPLAGVCIQPGTLVQTAPVTSSFGPTGQDITTGATYTGVLTDLSNTPVGSVVLTGTVRELIEGRTSGTETGTWTTRLLDLSLTGTVSGAPFTVKLDSAHDSTGTTSITLINDGSNEGQYLIDSFFDIFVDLTLETPVPLNTTRGPIRVAAGEVPEPATIALLGSAMLGLVCAGRRRRAVSAR